MNKPCIVPYYKLPISEVLRYGAS